jgi:hypothetical protein
MHQGRHQAKQTPAGSPILSWETPGSAAQPSGFTSRAPRGADPYVRPFA